MKKQKLLIGCLTCCITLNNILLMPLADTIPNANSNKHQVILESTLGDKILSQIDIRDSQDKIEQEEFAPEEIVQEKSTQEKSTQEESIQEESPQEESAPEESTQEESAQEESAQKESAQKESSESCAETDTLSKESSIDLRLDKNFSIKHHNEQILPEELTVEEAVLYTKLDSWMQTILEEKIISRRIAYKDAIGSDYDLETPFEEIEEDIAKQLTVWKENFQIAFDAFMNVYGYALDFDTINAEVIHSQIQNDGKISVVVNIAFTIDMADTTAENIISRFYGANTTSNYAKIDYSDRALKYLVKMKGNISDCGVASMASIEAFVNQSANGDYYYNRVYQNNGNSVYCYWGANGYSTTASNLSLEFLYQKLKNGPCIVRNGVHYSVLVGYTGSSSSLTAKDFRVMEVGYWTMSMRIYSLSSWLSSNGGYGYLTQICWRNSYPTDLYKLPQIVSAEVVEQSSAGYRINVAIKKGTNEISRVQFPTWTIYRDQDDLKTNWWDNSECSGKYIGNDVSGNTVYTYWVLDQDHNYEKGTYATDIYVFDTAENYAVYKTLIVNLQNVGEEWSSVSWNGHLYRLITDNLSWSEAKEACEKAGGHLATITSEEEQQKIEWLCRQDSGYGNTRYQRELYYLGGTVEDGKVSWITGEDAIYSPKWSEGQPDNYNNEETILTVYSVGSGKGAGTWNDMRTDSNICGYIMEIEPTVTSITLSPDKITLQPGESKKISVTLKPDNIFSKKIIWKSDNTAVVTIDDNGVIHANAAGTATITATVDGKSASCVVTVETKNAETFVKRLYKIILQKEPDQTEYWEWVYKLENHSKTGAEIAYQFAFSDEYTHRNISDEEFVNTMYLALLGRKADSTGRNYWLDTLKQGMSCEFVFKGLTNSKEFTNLCKEYNIEKGTIALSQNRDQNYSVTCFVSRCYSEILNRKGDANGLNYWTGKILSKEVGGGNTVSQFMRSNEFQKRNISASSTIDIVYKVMLDRKADPSGKKYWVDIANSGVSTDYIVNGFISSSEFVRICASYGITSGTVKLTESRDKNLKVTKFVTRCYEKSLGRKGDNNGLNYWTGCLIRHERTPEKVAHDFVFSDEVKRKKLGDAEFTDMLYRICLDRNAETSGREYWINKLKSGMSREDVFNCFAQSKEFKGIIASYGL